MRAGVFSFQRSKSTAYSTVSVKKKGFCSPNSESLARRSCSIVRTRLRKTSVCMESGAFRISSFSRKFPFLSRANRESVSIRLIYSAFIQSSFLISKTAPALFTLVRSNFSCNSASVKISCVSPLPGFHPRSATKLIRASLRYPLAR